RRECFPLPGACIRRRDGRSSHGPWAPARPRLRAADSASRAACAGRATIIPPLENARAPAVRLPQPVQPERPRRRLLLFRGGIARESLPTALVFLPRRRRTSGVLSFRRALEARADRERQFVEAERARMKEPGHSQASQVLLPLAEPVAPLARL